MADRLGQIRSEVEPALAALGLTLWDVEMTGSGRGTRLRILVDREGGIDLTGVTDATRAVEPILDARTDLNGPYELEVSSPGLERPLRTPAHFRHSVGSTMECKAPGPEGTVRHRGVLREATDTDLAIEVMDTTIRLPYADVPGARTVFEWGTPQAPGKKPGARGRKEKARS